jgi:hypothetical protein
MRVQLDVVGKAEGKDVLPATTLVFETGRATLGFAETEQRPSVLGLLASGRMRPDSGRVLIDGEVDRTQMRRRIALVDAPDISAPEPNVAVSGVVGEELMFAGRRAGHARARKWLGRLGMADAAHLPISNLDPARRIRMLCELAVLRGDVEGLVVVSPDRHGGDPRVWWGLGTDFADRGFAVLMIAGEASRLVLGPATGVGPDVPADPTAELPVEGTAP